MTIEPYKIIDVTIDNLEQNNLFCLQSKKDSLGYQAKVNWFKDRFKEGMKIKILNVHEGKRGYRTRGFIEYIPSEYTWRGIDAKGYLVIHCIWVVGQNKDKGYGSALLNECLTDAKLYNGVVVLTNKKGHWLPKPGLFKKHNFILVDTFQNNLELYAKKLEDNTPNPKFQPFDKKSYSDGLTILISDQCPYNLGSAKLVEEYAKKNNIPYQKIKINNSVEAQLNGYHPYGTFCILHNNEFLTYYSQNEIGLDSLISNKKIAINSRFKK
ncbi:MAG: hypothetical protein FK734_10580 [Asgard group archaeon]|nr:hypothetical protein [Asgard group archaeon]